MVHKSTYCGGGWGHVLGEQIFEVAFIQNDMITTYKKKQPKTFYFVK